jgi:hypothetical protein
MNLDIKKYAFQYAHAQTEEEREIIFLDVKNELAKLLSNKNDSTQKANLLAIYDQILAGVKEIQTSLNQEKLAEI